MEVSHNTGTLNTARDSHLFRLGNNSDIRKDSNLNSGSSKMLSQLMMVMTHKLQVRRQISKPLMHNLTSKNKMISSTP